MYTLYYNRQEKEIKVQKAKKAMQNVNFPDEVTYYNNVYYVCSKRKPLIDKAKEIKQGWISELEQELILIKEINI